MKIFTQKHNILVYLILVITLITLIGFFLLPIINTIVQANFSTQAASSLSADKQEQLSSQALGYELVLEREPDNQTALKGLLEIKLQQGDLQGAIAPLEQLAKLNSDFPDYTILLAQAKEQLNDYQGAENAYQSIVTNHPEDMKAWLGLVNLLLNQNRSEDAINLINQQLSSNNPLMEVDGLKLLLAMVYASNQQTTEAIAIYDQLITANAQDFRPILAKALVLQKQGKDTEAQELFTRASTLAPDMYKKQIETMANQTHNLSEIKEPS